MQKTITRNTVIKALRTEPLKRGDFFHYNTIDNRYGDTIIDTKKCNVCAVGAVLRTCGVVKKQRVTHSTLFNIGENATQNSYMPWNSSLSDNLKNKNYLGALSVYFESVSSRRSDLVKFVKKNFPFYITFNV